MKPFMGLGATIAEIMGNIVWLDMGGIGVYLDYQIIIQLKYVFENLIRAVVEYPGPSSLFSLGFFLTIDFGLDSVKDMLSGIS